MGLLDRTKYHMITNKVTSIAFPSQCEVAIRAAEEILKIHSRKAELLEAKS